MNNQPNISHKNILALIVLLSGFYGYSQVPTPVVRVISGSNCNSVNLEAKTTAPIPNGVTHKWYVSQTGSQTTSHDISNIPTGEYYPYVTTKTITSSATYWVAARLPNGQESARVQISGNGSSPVPNLSLGLASQGALCRPQAQFEIYAGGGASGSEYFWYSTSNTSGTPLYEGTLYRPTINYSQTSSGTKRYWVRAVMNYENCSQTVTQTKYVDVSFASATPTPSASANAGCGSRQVTLIASGAPSGGSYRWYLPNGNSVSGNTSNTYTTTTLSSSATYQVSIVSNNGCEGSKHNVIAPINGGAPATPQANNQSTTCGSNQVTLAASSSNPNSSLTYKWYTAATGSTTITPTTSTPQVSTYTVTLSGASRSFWVSAKIGNCESARTQVTASYGAASPLPELYLGLASQGALCRPQAQFEIYAGGGTSGSKYYWYATSNTSGTALYEGILYSPTINYSDTNSGTKRYWVRAVMNRENCSQTVTDTKYFDVSFAPASPTPSGSANTGCGSRPVTLTANGAPSGGSYRWYLPNGNSVSGNTSNIYTTTTLSSSATYQVSIISSVGCEGARQDITAQITDVITWYLDADEDGYAASFVDNCTSPGPKYTQNEIPLGDCDDSDDVINPDTIWYEDADGDDLGNSRVTIVQCEKPVGYVSNSNDQCLGFYSTNNDCAIEPLSTDPASHNYVYARTYQEPRSSVTAFFTEDGGLIQQISYFDGLGRGLQQIGIDQSPNKNDIVTYMEYDDIGRMQKEWLPYPTVDNTLATFRIDAKSGIEGHYNSSEYENTLNAYSEKAFEPSPLNRVLKQGAPGNNWQITAVGDDHSIEFRHDANETNKVRQFLVSTSFSNNTYIPTLEFGVDPNDNNIVVEYYPAGELSKTITYDENHVSGKNHSTGEFTNKQGRVILKRSYADIDLNGDGDTLDTGETEVPHDTYYVYDDFGNLTYVLPPKMNASESSNSLATLQGNVNALGYRYVYDYRNRLVEKQIPGKNKEYIIYNKLDQPIMTQDANQRLIDEWLFTKYDAFGRVAYTGKAVDNQERKDVQEDVDALTVKLWVERQTSATLIGGANIYYNDGTYPTSTLTEVLTVNYYDSYVDLPSGAPLSITILDDPDNATETTKVKGLATISRVKVLDQVLAKWVNTLTYYDDKGRPVYTYSENQYLGTIDIAETQLDFIGKLLKSRTSHTRNGNTIVTIDNFTYDHVGRLLSQTQCIGDENLGDSCGGAVSAPENLPLNGPISTTKVATNSITVTNAILTPVTRLYIDPNATGSGESNTEELIVFNEYDELGQLEEKKVGGTHSTIYDNTQGLQKVDYEYNVRGWLTGINNESTTNSNQAITMETEDLFGFQINYNNPHNFGANQNPTSLYNGNISQVLWKSKSINTSGNPVSERYSYSYDALNRIAGGIDNTDNYNLTDLSYDKNGNIKSLKRKGHTNVAITLFDNMDDLTYAYDDGNKLLSVTDAVNTSPLIKGEFKDGNKVGNDYVYDANGNMTIDKNKGITSIVYNHLNLPTDLNINGGGANVGAVSYIYDATGVKLKKITTEGSSVTTDYAGNYVYENDKLQFFSTAEGTVSPKDVNDYSAGFDYTYNYKDHLGNVRLSYTDANNDGDITTNEIVQENSYYPFGLKHKGYNNNVSSLGNSTAKKFKYNGKELEEDLGKDTYAYGWRDYDPAIGRFNKIDRFAEKYVSSTPYNYAANNPMYFIDVQGDSLWIQHKGNKILYQNGNVYNKNGTAYTGKGVKVNKDGTTKLTGFLKTAVNGLTAIAKEAEGSSMISELQSSDNNFTIVNAKGSKFNSSDNYKAYANQWATDPAQSVVYAMLQKGGKNFSGGSGGIINWKSSGSPLVTLSGTKTNGTTDLAHEMFHALDANRGLLDDRLHNGLKRSEWQATYRENTLRTQLGLPIRSHYNASLNAATGARTGLSPRMLSPAPTNSPILPSWYKK